MNQIDNIIVLRSPHGHSARLRPLTAGRTLLLDTELPDSVQATTSLYRHGYPIGTEIVLENHDLPDVVRYARINIEAADRMALVVTSSYPATKRLPWPCELPRRGSDHH